MGSLLLVGAGAVTAGAAPEWTPVTQTPLPAVQQYVFNDVSLASGGGATVGVTTVSAEGRIPAVIERAARGSGWTSPTTLISAGRVDIGPLVERNARGDAVAVWGVTGEAIVAAVKSRGGAWRVATPIGIRLPALRNNRVDDTIKIALSESGVARVVVVACSGKGCLMSELRTPVARTKWVKAPQRRLPAAAIGTLAWEVGRSGHVVAAWKSGATLRGFVSRFSDKVAGREQRLAGGPVDLPVSVDVGSRGEAAVSWTGVAATLQTKVRLPSDIAWRPSRGILRVAGASGGDVAIACDGSLTAAWIDPLETVRATTAAGPGGPFSEASTIGIFGANTKPVSVAVTTAGLRGIVTWARAEQESAGMSLARLGDPDNAFAGQNPDFGFREAPAPTFASDGHGIVVSAGDDVLRVQEIEPDPERLQCAR